MKRKMLVLIFALSFLLIAAMFTEPRNVAAPWVARKEKEVRLAFVGDIMLDRYIRAMAETKGYDFIFASTTPLWGDSDIVIGNLEGPITKHASKSRDTVTGVPDNYVFTFAPESSEALSRAGIRVVSLANNHILNFGHEGLATTKAILRANGIDYFGNPSADEMSLLKELHGRTIAFIPFNQFIMPDEKRTQRSIIEASRRANFVVVFAHWGEEYWENPNATQIKLAHAFVDAGADLVVGAHPHVLQKKELYKGKTIYTIPN